MTKIALVSLDTALAAQGPVLDSLRAAFPSCMAVYAFGSQIQGTAGPDSDLDLAILVAGYADPVQLWEMASQLADTVGCPVDLLDLRAASTVMQHQILSKGRCIWSNGLEASLFECFVFSEKLSLDQARAPLLAQIAKTGSVYAK